MLEIKHVSKTYQPKKGVPVKALDDVSLSFGDRGLVFILGKSGSGKSTLLNVIGGLDKADSGEFSIKGKSSSNFSQGDFDAYRNTFIGFIFQEYNILNEFSVGQNIALAMELQGKKVTSERLNEILDMVDLGGYAGRKPNELSGGQKQRVAIARALVKEPEIIMADEPTGALDSNTGKQVFDTLKKLSETKLVIVVSHDREFAEYYGDRVIELADGKVISDISKYEAVPEMRGDGVRVIDDSIIQIKKGYVLTEKDLAVINAYLQNHREDLIISADARANSNFKQIAMIDDDGKKASFRDTVESKNTYDASETKFIKSRLPYKNALKIGASSLKVKPVRLFFTILLSFVAFALFGLADTMAAYDKYTTALNSITAAGTRYVSFAPIRSSKNIDGSYADYGYEMNGNDRLFAELKEKTGAELKPVFGGTDTYSSLTLPGLKNGVYNEYYTGSTGGLVELDAEDIRRMGFSVKGKMPEADDEIAITQYLFANYKTGGLRYVKYSDNPNVPEEATISAENLTADENAETGILGKSIETNYEGRQNRIKIVGIVDTNLSERYDRLKSGGNREMSDYLLIKELVAETRYGVHGLTFVHSGVVKELSAGASENTVGEKCLSYLRIPESDRGEIRIDAQRIMTLSDADSSALVRIDGKNGQALAKDEIMLPGNIYESYLRPSEYECEFPAAEFYTGEFRANGDRLDCPKVSVESGTDPALYLDYVKTDALVKYVMNHPVPDAFKELYGENRESYYNYIRSGQLNPYGLSYRQIEQIAEITLYRDLGKLTPLDNVSLETENESEQTVRVVGFYVTDPFENSPYTTLIVSDEFMSKHSDDSNGAYTSFIGVIPENAADLKRLIEFSYDYMSENGIRYNLKNGSTESLSQVNGMIENLSSVFLYIALGLAAFAGLMLANFISVSISNKKREIGVLRAVGAKARDVFTIFFNESFIISMINFVLAIAGAIAGTIVLNSVIASSLGLTILFFGIRQVAIMLAICIGVAVLASFFPVYSIARKQPIDSIQGR